MRIRRILLTVPCIEGLVGLVLELLHIAFTVVRFVVNYTSQR